MSDAKQSIEQFLYREARLLDSNKIAEWLDLFTDDAIYWVPAGGDDIDPLLHVSIIHDDKPALAKRVKRLASGFAYAQMPASRTHRMISNIELEEISGDEAKVHCVMLLTELSRHRQTVHSARCLFSLNRQGDGWRIRRKQVNLLRNDEMLEVTAFLL
jgi:benzoate/toluate 1,2-dioxygenase subunit beta